MNTERRAYVIVSEGDSHSDVLVIGPAKKWPEVGMSPSDRLDTSVPGRGPTWCDDLVPQSGSKPSSRVDLHVGEIP